MEKFSFNWQEYQRVIEDNFTIIDKNKIEVPFILNKAQINFLQTLGERNVILKARKMGFSSVLLAVAVVKFIYGKNERCYSMSFDQTASAKQLDRAKHFIKSYERSTKRTIPLKYNSKSEMVWEGLYEDGSGYVNALRVGTAKSTGFGRGDDITFLHLTEVSLADDIDALLAGAGEAVVNNAIISLETTANGYNQFKTFWDEAASGARGYKTFFYDPTWEYSEEFVARKRLELGRLADQEYPMTPEAAFIASGAQYFDKLSLQDYLKETVEVETDQNHFRKYRDFEQGEFILVFADTAGGGGDFCAAHFLSKQKLDIPLVYHSKNIVTEMTPTMHEKLEEIHDITGVPPVICYEQNNGGIYELERLASLNRRGKYIIYRQKMGAGTRRGEKDSPKLGWNTNTATRPQMLVMCKDMVDNRLLTIYDRPTITEAFSFVEVQTSSAWKAQAEKGAHDDLIMALAGVWQMYQTEKPLIRNRRPKKQKYYDKDTGRVLS